MEYVYRYLGTRSVRIGETDYETNDLIRLDKPIAEFGFSGHQFELLNEMFERKYLRQELKKLKTKEEKIKKRIKEIDESFEKISKPATKEKTMRIKKGG